MADLNDTIGYCTDYLIKKAEEALIDEEYEDAFNYYKRAAENGNTNAMLKLARYCRDKNIPPFVKTEAIKWYSMAAERNVVAACNELAILYFESFKDEEQQLAIKYINKAAELAPYDSVIASNKSQICEATELVTKLLNYKKIARICLIIGAVSCVSVFIFDAIATAAGIISGICVILAVIFGILVPDSVIKDVEREEEQKKKQEIQREKDDIHTTTKSIVNAYRQSGGIISERINVNAKDEIVVALDDVHKKCLFIRNGNKKIYNYKDFMYAVINTERKTETAVPVKAKIIAGSVIAGPVGALVGATSGTSVRNITNGISVKVYLNNGEQPMEIVCLTGWYNESDEKMREEVNEAMKKAKQLKATFDGLKTR